MVTDGYKPRERPPQGGISMLRAEGGLVERHQREVVS